MIALQDLPAPADRYPVRRALLSVSDKTGLVDFASRLAAHGVALVSTGGTASALRAAGLTVADVADVTGVPEMLGGRVKSLHPAIHGGILAQRTSPADLADLATHGIAPVDLVVVNLYPFADAVATDDVTDALAAENIDIGGPGMLRAAAKNFAFVAAVARPADYAGVADELDAHAGTLGRATRRRLAQTAFAHTAAYDTAIADYLAGTPETEAPAAESPEAGSAALPARLRLDLPLALGMRYGENPHQPAALYGHPEAHFETLWGKALSYNNLLDATAALRLVAEFSGAPPTVAILKHTNPCGVGQGATLAEAYARAFATDTQSPFGGIVVANRPLDMEAARAVDAVFTEVVIAPGFDDGVLEFLQQKANRRIVRSLGTPPEALTVRSVVGGVLVQTPDVPLPGADLLRAAWTVPTQRQPTETEWAALDLAWRVCKHVTSNAIVYADAGATLGIGAGQMSRLDASRVAVSKAAEAGLSLAGSAVASEAFFPFPDGLLAAADAGATAAVQPGGSVRDADVIAAADARGMAMVLTGTRHFRH
ncbi:MAG TPA: bifunctional phosphoribosylaminoimidazolecarboxamide formyltransferase/IMP cyclohydrolase [Rubricoccaceae bacterium]